MSSRILLVTAISTLLIVSSAQAAVVTTPSSLSPGDEYRLAFVTSGTRDSTATDITDYDAFVTTAADAVPELLSLSVDWLAIASTASVSAREHTGTDPTPAGDTGVPIFLLNDTSIADHYDDLWDGSLDASLSVSELGTTLDVAVWTGTTPTGEISGSSALGLPFGLTGLSISPFTTWVDDAATASSGLRNLYGLSGVLTVVPEPSAFFLIVLGAGVVGVVRVRPPTTTTY